MNLSRGLGALLCAIVLPCLSGPAGARSGADEGPSPLGGMLSHISNFGLCEHNDGLDNLGIRYGYRF